MEWFLLEFSVILLIIAIGVVINERFFKIPAEIALLCLSLVGGIILKLLLHFHIITPGATLVEQVSSIRLDQLLMDALLCFMLFSGASDLKLRSLKEYFKPIALFALLTTVITAALYGGLFYLVLSLFGMKTNIVICMLLGAIVSPTDPIAATGILNKLGLPKEIVSIMEGESLFNDGVGVALFVFVSGLLTHTSEGGFFVIMFKELFGAIGLALVVCFICSLLVKRTKNQTYHIIFSLLAVASCYALCEIFGFSGAIASVVCGIYFATMMENLEEKNKSEENEKVYDHFWDTVDKLLNYVLYVFIGLSFVSVVHIEYALLAIIMAIFVNFITRFGGVFTSTLFIRKMPGGYSKLQFTTLMTWSGLKGGLSLALVMSVASMVPVEVYDVMLFIVYSTIIFTTVIQGLTVSKLYLGLNKSLEKKKKA